MAYVVAQLDKLNPVEMASVCFFLTLSPLLSNRSDRSWYRMDLLL
jgi:hypothetical protein